MGNSLQDQLLKAGIVNKQKASKVNAEKRKKTKQSHQSKSIKTDPDKLAVQQAQAEKIKKDKLLNQELHQQSQKKAIEAQIRQLITNNRQLQNDSETAYNFADNGIVKKIYVNEVIREQITNGKMAIAKIDSQYEVIPIVIAKKIDEQNKTYLIVMNEPDNPENTIEDDAYADYEIPSDLMW